MEWRQSADWSAIPKALTTSRSNTSMVVHSKRIDNDLESLPKAKARLIEPMLLLRTVALPEAAEWLDELKLDGYRALAINGAGGCSCGLAMTTISA